jgi:hypothetical protein
LPETIAQVGTKYAASSAPLKVLIRQSVVIPLPVTPPFRRSGRFGGVSPPNGDGNLNQSFTLMPGLRQNRDQKENPASRRDFPSFQFTGRSSKSCSELAVPLTLLALLTLTRALAVRILLLLAGLLAAALLLTGLLPRVLILLTRVLILLTRVLVLIRHRGFPFVVETTSG